MKSERFFLVSARPSSMRLFIAVNFSVEVRTRLIALRDKLRANAGRGSFTAPENLHLTLQFLGECDAGQIAAAKAAMAEVRFAPFDLSIDHVGCFKREDGDIWWAAIAENGELLKLQCALADRLRLKGFVLEKRRYSPHITLGRRVTTDMTAWSVDSFGETVTSIELMRSERVQGKLVYTAVHSKRAVEIF